MPKATELPIAVLGKTVGVSFEATQAIANASGGIEIYGKTESGGEVRLFIAADAAPELDVDLS